MIWNHGLAPDTKVYSINVQSSRAAKRDLTTAASHQSVRPRLPSRTRDSSLELMPFCARHDEDIQRASPLITTASATLIEPRSATSYNLSRSFVQKITRGGHGLGLVLELMPFVRCTTKLSARLTADLAHRRRSLPPSSATSHLRYATST